MASRRDDTWEKKRAEFETRKAAVAEARSGILSAEEVGGGAFV